MARQIDAQTEIPLTETERGVWRRVFEEMLYRCLRWRADRGILRNPELRRKYEEMEEERRA